ncbi:cation transport atpase [Stylonychia lemnae]|uniref:Cation transport atpase n=1 Tax=Stylonychia lemnae TaxID=5949 RepID=A0A077ZSE8_STYLE|nr:cation transport atpase [Stylonychia lemnae]|eukprot:CDW72469.1 cation transport atpase [Stylonychia lemnae]
MDNWSCFVYFQMTQTQKTQVHLNDASAAGRIIIISVLQVIPQTSNLSGTPFELLSLIVILLLTTIIEYHDDFKRKNSDRRENKREVQVYDAKKEIFVKTQWQHLKVGQVVLMEQNDLVPADMILIKSSCPSGLCYLESQNLQGENDLLKKVCDRLLYQIINPEDPKTVKNLKGSIISDSTNASQYNFTANMYLHQSSNRQNVIKRVQIDEKQLILRGCKVKNTKWVMGLIIAAGHDTNLMRNTIKLINKKSFINRDLNLQVIIILLFSIILSVSSAIYYVTTNIRDDCDDDSQDDQEDVNCEGWTKLFFMEFLIWFIQYKQDIFKFYLYSNLIPISLLFTLEFVRIAQTYFIQHDCLMFDNDQMLFPSVQSSQLLEELGQVQVIFSDKTGTMTANIMRFRKIACGQKQYAPIFGNNRKFIIIEYRSIQRFYCIT